MELSHLYACFKGQPTNSLAMVREYGSGNVFRERSNRLAAAAKAFFVGHCNQTDEGEFDLLLTRCNGFAARRNDIAHGVVQGLKFHFIYNAATNNVDVFD